MQIQLSDEALVRKVNAKLVPELRQSAVLCEFVEPVSLPKLQDLTLCRLFPDEEARSEEQRYKVRLSDPAFVMRIRCSQCGGQVQMVGPNLYQCKNRRCDLSSKRVVKISHRGVTSVMWHKSFVARVQEHSWMTSATKTGDLVDVDLENVQVQTSRTVFLAKCIAMLDRRYDPVSIAAIYRTIGALCDQNGWKLKNVE